MSQKRNLSIGRWSARKPRLIELIKFRNAMNPASTIRTVPVAMMAGFRSAFS